MLPVKATIEVQDGADRDNPALPRTFSVQFNPTEYTLNKGAQIAEIAIPGIDSPLLQFVRGQNEKLTLDLFFDTTRPDGTPPARSSMADNARDVRELTGPFYQLVKIQSKTHAPPRILFYWGEKQGGSVKGFSFKAIVESVQQKFTLFSPQGMPLRATLTVTFREYRTLEEQLKEMKLESSDHTKQHVVRDGDTLSSIAAQEYQDPAKWRVIAEHADNAGKIRSARRLTPGTVLTLPPLELT